MFSWRWQFLIVFLSGSALMSLGCGIVKTNDSGKKPEGTTEQPADVAGGLGLSCLESVNLQSVQIVDYSCSVIDQNGNKFTSVETVQTDAIVTLSGQAIPVKKEGNSRFLFSIPRSKSLNVQVSLTFTNPINKKILRQVSPSLFDLAKWSDVTLTATNAPSTCLASPTNCTLQDSLTRLWWSKLQSPTDGFTWDEAKSYCGKLSHNRQPNTSIGAKAWRMPTADEIVKISNYKDIHSWVSDEYGWMPSNGETYSFWAATGGGFNDSNATSGNNATVVQFSSHAQLSVTKTEKHALVCVLDRSDNWADITTTPEGSESSCNQTPDRCTMRDELSMLWWTRPQSAQGGLAWGDAKSVCSSLSYNGQTGWRLPTADELRSATLNDIRNAASDAWINADVMNTKMWSSDYSSANVDAYSAEPATGYRGVEPVSNKNTVVCVRPQTVYWQDLTSGGSCSGNRQNCVLKLSVASTLYSGVLTGATAVAWKTWDDAKALCQSYQPDGTGGWALPTMTQMARANAYGIKEVTGWRGDGDMGHAFWSSEPDTSSALINTYTFLYGSTGMGLQSNGYQVICVKSL